MGKLSACVCVGLLLAGVSTAQADSKAKTHDGFHFQTQLGLGYYQVSIDDAADSKIKGITTPMAFLFGGNITKQIILGGGLVFDIARTPTIESGGNEADANFDQYIVGLGAYLDYYMDPVKNGLHFQGYLGWGGLEESEGTGGSDPTGAVIYAGGGYDWWISDQWSAGVMGRLLYGPFKFNGQSVKTIEPGVVGTLTWH